MISFNIKHISHILCAAVLAVLIASCASVPNKNEQLISQLEQLNVTVSEDERGLVITLPTVYFDFDSSNLKTDSRAKIAEIARVVGQDLGADRKIEIEGHTDNVGEPAYNLNLSARRAEVVLKELAFSNIPEARMSSSGKGEAAPIDDNTTTIGRQHNRRVEIILLKP